MSLPLPGPLDRFLQRRAIARWRSATQDVSEMGLAALDRRNDVAKRLLHHIGAFKVEADSRLALPRVGSTTFPQPPGTDWAWRPTPWRAPVTPMGIAPALPKMAMTNELVIFHDCKRAEVSLRQVRNGRETDLAPFGIDLQAFHFEGSYLSLVIEIPKASCEGLKKRHLIRLGAVIEREHPTPIYARLNVKNGPNTEQVLLTLPDDTPETIVEFDLAYSGLNEKRAERMWIDLMIERPAMNKVSIRDLTFCRYPRADI
ncbi:DUF6478 family protein [Roseobacter sp. CCS2]|uniref:DUF6478 family protein n=1 Tax=Roseobacter sp. CCS2 TaxID=391593 RepID=UPI0000F40054|nr:DUF6478 family protein [Roseobacter sp. CCS2]EBA13705.1 hypothetical protein RCCS2_07449 [Roseobacter sp. CCS2]